MFAYHVDNCAVMCIRTKYLMESYSTWSQAEGLEILGVVTGGMGNGTNFNLPDFVPQIRDCPGVTPSSYLEKKKRPE